MEELQGAINYSLRKCFADAKFKLEQPVSVESSPTPALASSPKSPSKVDNSIAQKLSESSGGSPRSGYQGSDVIVARPYHSVRDQENEKGDEGKDSGGSNSDEIIVMDDDDESDVYDLDEDEQNTSIEF